jgi:hypothetical protein
MVSGRDNGAVGRGGCPASARVCRRPDAADPAHQIQLDRERAERRLRHQVEVAIWPLPGYDRLIPA